MTPAADRIVVRLLQLSPADRAELAALLLDSLDPAANAPGEAAWSDEIRSRIEDIRSGKLTPVPWTVGRAQIQGDVGVQSPEVVRIARDRAYFDILHHGLVFLRNFARSGQLEFCPIEAEHLHEIPTLIGETNEGRHVYYLRGTRELYLQQLRDLGDAGYLKQVAIWYTHPWRVLSAAAGVELDA